MNDRVRGHRPHRLLAALSVAAIAVAAWQIADGVLVNARMNRAFAVFSMLEIRTPPASEITTLF